MPEIKKHFTNGRMNKDIDERLVPDGEYRDAMNIQISSSEEGGVATAQNILGNKSVCDTDFFSPFSQTIAAISDEKNDTLYWFVAGQNTAAESPTNEQILEAMNKETNLVQILADFADDDIEDEIMLIKDMIMRKRSGKDCEPVFVDTYAFLLANNEGISSFPGIDGGDSIFSSSMILGVDSEITSLLEPGWEVMSIDGNGDSLGTTEVEAVLNVTGYDFEAGYDPITSQIGGAFFNAHIGAQAKQNNNYQFIKNKIYVRPSDFSWSNNNTIPIGAEVVIPGYTQANTVVADIQTIDIHYGGQSTGLSQTWVQIRLDKNLNLSNLGIAPYFLNVNSFQTSQIGNYFVVDTHTSTMVGGAVGGIFTSIDGVFDGHATYDFTIVQGIPNGDLIIDANDIENIEEGDPLVSEYGGNINWPYQGEGLCVGSVNTNTNIITIENCDTGDQVNPYMVWGSTGNIILQSNNVNTIQLTGDSSDIDLGDDCSAILFNGGKKRVLNFNRRHLITGINIMDDMLFWTDNNTEPKKINISRSIEGTESDGNTHTRVVNKKLNPPLGLKSDDSNNEEIPIKEANITVVKKAPKASLNLVLKGGRDFDKNYSGVMRISDRDAIGLSDFIGSSLSYGRYSFSGVNAQSPEDPGNYHKSTVRFQMGRNANGDTAFELEGWEVGKTVVLREFEEDGGPPPIPLSEYTIKAVIEDWPLNKFIAHDSAFDADNPNHTGPARVKLRIVQVKGEPPIPSSASNVLDYVVDLFEEDTKTLFQYKFPRFSYRYKYEDGEISTFAPWSEVAFLPGSFDYHPKKGYNLGMVNRLKELELTNFVTDDMPKDVVAIDLLYKDDTSPNIYLVDTIKPDVESTHEADGLTPWYKNRVGGKGYGSYTITNDTIHSMLPSDQFLRTWDNVPSKALAQEIVGNRLVYANYTQGFDLRHGEFSYEPVFKHKIVKTSGASKTSIKSLRDYQLGVVLTDKYGRETPVLTNRTGQFSLGKSSAANFNRLKVGLRYLGTNNFPKDVEYYKFFIKETSGEYFNLPMDRWYDADDGNVWLSFQSTDRNKLDVDTYIILKKGENSDEVITDHARYKIIAIENEAPDFIKTRMLNVGSMRQRTDLASTTWDDRAFDTPSHWPLVGGTSFAINKSAIQPTHSLFNLPTIEEDLYVEFTQGNRETSNRYKITNASQEKIEDNNGNMIDGDLSFSIEGQFGKDIEFIFEGSPLNPTGVESTTKITFYKAVIENSPKFDGKFFVKIFADDVFDRNIRNAQDTDTVDYTILTTKRLSLVPPDMGDIHKRWSSSDASLRYNVFGNGTDHLLVDMYGNKDVDAENPQNQGAGSDYNSQGWTWQKKGDGNDDDDSRESQGKQWFKRVPSQWAYWRAFMKDDITNIHQHPLHLGSGSSFDPSKLGSTSDDRFVPRLPKDFVPTFGVGTDCSGGTNKGWTADIHACICNDGPTRNKTYEDVYFIDAGQKRGVMDPRTWTRTAYGTGSPNDSIGIKNYNSANEGRIEIGFGPMQTDPFDPASENGDGHWRSGSHRGWLFFPEEEEDWNNFWDITRPDFAEVASFFQKMQPGQRFRWREDPTKTVYTFFGNTVEKYYARFEGYDPQHGYLDEDNYQDKQRGMTWAIYDTSNYTVGLKAGFKPAMKQWNPISTTGGSTATRGTMSNGRLINKTWDGLTYNAGDNQPTTSNLTANVWGSNYVKILKNNFNTSYDNRYSEHARIEVGMALTNVASVTRSGWISSGEFDDIWIVSEIEETSNNFKVTLGGYERVTYPNNEDLTDVFSGGEALTFKQVTMNGLSVNSQSNINHYNDGGACDGIVAVNYNIEFITPLEREALLPEDPSVWETEPKDNVDIDIYHEISGNNPIALKQDTILTAIPIGSVIESKSTFWNPTRRIEVREAGVDGNDIIKLNLPICGGSEYGCDDISGDWIPPIEKGDIFTINKPNGIKYTVEVDQILEAKNYDSAPDSGHTWAKKFRISKRLYTSWYELDWHNCWSFGNGVESNRIGDTFNMPYISNGVDASTTSPEEFTQDIRKHGLIYSGLYNSTTGFNALNQFSMAEKISKEINPTYGRIQKLYMRNDDLVVFCEDKVLQILANKDAVYNADGNPNLIASNRVLGQVRPFAGEYGISRNPESFASESYRCYFTDKTRGAVLRLSMDGLTVISDQGMKDWFRDNLKLSHEVIGSYDEYKNEYNVTLIKPNVEIGGDEIVFGPGMSFFLPSVLYEGEKHTVTFREDVKGWVSFKSFTPENAISCANKYYSFDNGQLWRHHREEVDRNNFYGQPGYSSITTLMNEEPGFIKTFNTLAYEGSQAKIDQLKKYNVYLPGTNIQGSSTYTGVTHPDYVQGIADKNYYNLESKNGWYVDSIKTDQEEGGINEFIEKEGKWFNYIKGKQGTEINENDNKVDSGFDNADNSFQGLGTLWFAPTVGSLQGCTDDSTFLHTDGNTYPSVINYDSGVSIDDGSCIDTVLGCTDPGAEGGSFSSTANMDTVVTSCIYYGCMDPGAFNYNANANTTDGSCIPIIYGCTDSSITTVVDKDGNPIDYPTMFNYNPAANTDDGSCVPTVLGCINQTANNYNPAANTDDGSCTYTIYGCLDSNSCDFSPGANTDDGSCTYCSDSSADNYDSGTCADNCLFCMQPNALDTLVLSDTEITLSWSISTAADSVIPNSFEIEITPSNGTSTTISWVVNNLSPGQSINYPLGNLQPDTAYSIRVRSICNNTSAWSFYVNATTQETPAPGCTDNSACNYDPVFNIDDGSCEFTSCSGCMDQTFIEYDPTATINDPAQCLTTIVYGCTDNTAFNWDSNANVDDGSCIPVILGCTDDQLGWNGTIAATNYDATANTDDGSCQYDLSISVDWIVTVNGDAQLVATVGNPPVGINGNSVLYMLEARLGAGASTIYDLVFGYNTGNAAHSHTDFVPNINDVVNNQLVLATISNTVMVQHIEANGNTQGSRKLYGSLGIMFTDPSNIGHSGFGNDTHILKEGCTDPAFCNYDATAELTISSNPCVPGSGCNDAGALNYDSNITCPNNADDCQYCTTDADVVNATLSYTDVSSVFPTAPNLYEINWNDQNTDITNGANTLALSGNYSTTQRAYNVYYKKKLPNGNWDTTWTQLSTNPTENNCNPANFPFVQIHKLLGPAIGLGPDDGRYDTGAKWRFKIENRCYNAVAGCKTASNLKTPFFTIP